MKNQPYMNPRRSFLRQSSLMAIGAGLLPTWSMASSIDTLPARKFKISLKPGSIGVSMKLPDLLDMAIKYKYEAIVASPEELLQMSTTDRAALVEKMNENQISWGASGLPVKFQRGADQYLEDMEGLAEAAAVCQEVGITRMSTYILPSHDHLTYAENFEVHYGRLNYITGILNSFDIRLGLEYVGPIDLLVRSKYPFIRTMAECQELIQKLGKNKVGIVLDAFHWYCAQDTVNDLLALSPEDIIAVDFNDARAGMERIQQVDSKRELPGATGVVDMEGFVGALKQIGYDGPVRAEPFNQPLNDMNNEAAIAKVSQVMHQVSGE